ncbi:hypothetical protein B0I35DRAFT_473397 [Stachybotrys elegans]|uniref:ATP-dependent RNA helicase DHX8 n=1 Tax=Stachybotrys elegans TaxID=80388 RepID=A0A8K0T4L2_9HYPO|nr:hypothetical protein B0I35DRAFT_473397 [Stachybotrys elegans]
MASSPVPYRQIRACYDANTITVYQAYKVSIAEAAVTTQRLNASPDFKPGRMTWVKPSWAWMMYRSGYSYKDPGQARILAIKMKREAFLSLLEKGVLSHHVQASEKHDVAADRTAKGREKSSDVRIQWDPERTCKLDVLPYRSIQIGIPGALSGTWAEEWIEAIEDVTEMARALKKTLDDEPDVTPQELVDRGLIPRESVFHVSPSIMERLEMVDADPKRLHH